MIDQLLKGNNYFAVIKLTLQDHFPVFYPRFHKYFSLFDEAQPFIKFNGIDLRVQEQVVYAVVRGDLQ